MRPEAFVTHIFYAIFVAALALGGCAPVIRNPASLHQLDTKTSESLVFLVQPVTSLADNAFPAPVSVALENQFGVIDTSFTGEVSITIENNSGAGVLSGTLSTNAVAGVATFPTLKINADGVGYTLSASSGSISTATSVPFNVVGLPSQLAFSMQPSNATAGSSLGNVTVTVEDSVGNTIPDSTLPIALAIGTNAGPAGTLSGAVSGNAVNGIAVFPGLNINRTGSGYTLTATTASLPLTTSRPFDISVGAANQLVFTSQPTSAASEASLGTITVTVEDSSGNKVSGSSAPVTLSIGNNAGPGGTLAGSLTVNAVNGVATFSGLSIDLDGAGYTLSASSPSLISAISNAFNISTAAPSKLVFSTQPSSAASNASLGSVAVTVTDAGGNKITTSSASITLAIGNNAGPSGTLAGTLSASAVNGVATFPGLSINIAGSGYTLGATSSGLTSATSTAFDISAGPANKLVFTSQPASAASGASLGTVAVTVEDLVGNKVTTSTAALTLAIANNAGGSGVLSGSVSVNAVAGVATFTGLSIDVAGTGYTLSAASTSLTSATSSAFNISVGAASKLVFTTQPANAASTASLGSIVVKIEDVGGNVCTSATSSVALAIGNNAGPGGTLSGTNAVTAVAGVATFPGLSIDKTGTGYTLTASASSLTGATSSSFNITAGPLASMAITQQPPNTVAGSVIGSTTGVVVTLFDAVGNQLSSSSTNVTVAIASGTGGTLLGTLTKTSSSGVVTFSDLAIGHAGTYTLKLTSGSITATSLSFTISAGPAAAFTFTPPGNLEVNICATGTFGTITSTDAFGNVANVPSSTSFTLGSNSATTTFYTAGSCTGATTSVTIPAGSSSVRFFMADSVSELVTVTGTNASLGGALSGSLYFFTALTTAATPATVTAGVCSCWTISNLDALGSAYNVSSDTAILVTGGSLKTGLADTGYYGSDSTCTTPSNSVTMLSGTSSVNLCFSDPYAENVTIGVQAPSGYFSQATKAVTVIAAAATATVIEGPSLIRTGSCSSAFQVTALDVFANRALVSGNTTVALSTSGATHFYSDASCMNSLGSNDLTISSGNSSALFYVMTSASESATLTATVSGYTSAGTFASESSSTAGTALVAVGAGSVCGAINGLLKCWGSGVNGLLGNGSSSSSMTAVPVTGMTHVSAVAVSDDAACAIQSGQVYCWGYGVNDELGSSSPPNSQSTPVAVSGLSSATAISAGSVAFCAIQSGNLYCWGSSGLGAFGGTLSQAKTPTQITLPSPVTSVAVGSAHICALLSDGSLYCWGDNSKAQLGNGTVGGTSGTPNQVVASGATALAAGFQHTCAVIGGAVECWGGAIALGGTFTTPTTISGLTGTFTGVGASAYASFALKSDGSLWCFGNDGNVLSPCATGVPAKYRTWVETLLISSVQSISSNSASNNACAVVTGAGGQPSVQCWGELTTLSYGVPGDGSIDPVYAPFWPISLN